MLFENFNEYKEIEFVCVNSGINSNTTTENQLNLYNDLKQIDGLLPYIQDWSEGDNIQKSLAVILLDKGLEPKVIELAKKHHIEIDLINSVDDKKVDDIISGRLENLV
jgi:hypothetical protein